jgi:hypothetical protein
MSLGPIPLRVPPKPGESTIQVTRGSVAGERFAKLFQGHTTRLAPGIRAASGFEVCQHRKKQVLRFAQDDNSEWGRQEYKVA